MKKINRTHSWVAVGLLGLAIAAPTAAQEVGEPEPAQKQQQKQRREQAQKQQQRQRGQAQAKQAPGKAINETRREAQQRMQTLREVSGTVLETKTVNVRGVGEENLVALIRTSRGDRRLVVDLGPADDLQQANIQQGERIAAEGIVTSIRDQQFLVASRIQAGGQTIEIDRAAQRQLHEQKTRGEQQGMQQQRQRQQRQRLEQPQRERMQRQQQQRQQQEQRPGEGMNGMQGEEPLYE